MQSSSDLEQPRFHPSALREEGQLLYSLRRDCCITPFSIICARSPRTYRSLHPSPHLPTPPVPSSICVVKQCFFRCCSMLRFRRTIGCSIHARAAATTPISSHRVQVVRGGRISRCVRSSSTYFSPLLKRALRHCAASFRNARCITRATVLRFFAPASRIIIHAARTALHALVDSVCSLCF